MSPSSWRLSLAHTLSISLAPFFLLSFFIISLLVRKQQNASFLTGTYFSCRHLKVDMTPCQVFYCVRHSVPGQIVVVDCSYRYGIYYIHTHFFLGQKIRKVFGWKLGKFCVILKLKFTLIIFRLNTPWLY